MTSAVSILPEQQLSVLNDAYRAAVARKRLRVTLAAAVFFAALIVAAVGAEVNLRTFFKFFGNFLSYFDRIFTLEDGTRVWTNPAEWFWGWRKWLWMLGETILISYVGTLIGAVYPDVFDRPASARLAMPAMLVGAFAIFVFGLVDLEFSPSKLFNGLHQLGWITLMMIPPDPGSSLPVYLSALGETLSIALLGTTLAAVLALPVSLLAARNIVPSNIFRFPVRRFLDSIRGVDTLIWALVWINVVGLGPFAGVLAIAVSDFGAFGKLFSEAIEAADRKQVEGIRASGGNALHEIRFGLMPQVLPVIAGQVLYFIESNTRSATIIGIVGAGGIGLQLAEQIRVLEWQKVSFLILMILVAVAAIDWISGKLRFAIIGQRAIA